MKQSKIVGQIDVDNKMSLREKAEAKKKFEEKMK